MIEHITQLIIEVAQELSEEFEKPDMGTPTKDTPLYGKAGGLKSAELVILISTVEQVISDKFDREIVIADERAMSSSNSPFRTIGTLATYVDGLMRDE